MVEEHIGEVTQMIVASIDIVAVREQATRGQHSHTRCWRHLRLELDCSREFGSKYWKGQRAIQPWTISISDSAR